MKLKGAMAKLRPVELGERSVPCDTDFCANTAVFEQKVVLNLSLGRDKSSSSADSSSSMVLL